MKSFIITGASASGKTTLVNQAIEKGYKSLPIHTTRPPRDKEQQNVHNVFISKEKFIENYYGKVYLEPTLSYAEQYGFYYGTPYSWINELKHGGCCGIANTPLIAKKICTLVDVTWISLYCDSFIREKRLIERGLSGKELQLRIESVNDHNVSYLASNTIIINTSFLDPNELFNVIKRYLHE